MKRRLVNLIAAVSLVVAIGLSIVWVRSYWRYELFDRFGLEGNQRLVISGGRVSYTSRSVIDRAEVMWEHRSGIAQPPQNMGTMKWYERIGFAYASQPSSH